MYEHLRNKMSFFFYVYRDVNISLSRDQIKKTRKKHDERLNHVPTRIYIAIYIQKWYLTFYI